MVEYILNYVVVLLMPTIAFLCFEMGRKCSGKNIFSFTIKFVLFWTTVRLSLALISGTPLQWAQSFEIVLQAVAIMLTSIFYQRLCEIEQDDQRIDQAILIAKLKTMDAPALVKGAPITSSESISLRGLFLISIVVATGIAGLALLLIEKGVV